MAITRRQFVTRLGAMAAAIGIGQADLQSLADSLAYGRFGGKPKVYWIHGAECTGCSTSLLGLFEDARGRAIETVDTAGTTDVRNLSTIGALGLAVAPDATVPRTLDTNGYNVDGNANAISIADVVIDFIDLKYHETIMGQGGDMAYDTLKQAMADTGTFVLVVEGAVQNKDRAGYWNKTGSIPWCSIAMEGQKDGGTDGVVEELAFDDVVNALASNAAATIAIGQCATYGGYPACQGPGLDWRTNEDGVLSKSQTGAKGVFDFLKDERSNLDAANKVINVPGCPANPWWFVLTVVAWLVDANAVLGGAANGPLGILKSGLAINSTAVDSQGRLKAVFGSLLHSKYCPRYKDYINRRYASKPGDPGCLKNIGCKGLSTMALCTRHGWNSQQPQNQLGAVGESVLYTRGAADGYPSNVTCAGNCISAGAPCMACTEKGYPDAFVPFVSKR